MDKVQGPFRTIKEAVEAAEATGKQGIEIRISSGLYTDNVVIKTNGLKLMAKDKDADIIWVAYVGPAILVDIPNKVDKDGKSKDGGEEMENERQKEREKLENHGKVTIENIKFAHTATDAVSPPKLEEDDESRARMVVNSMTKDGGEFEDRGALDPNGSYGKSLKIFDQMNTIIYVKRGRVELSQSVLSLNFIQRQEDLPLPAIVLKKGSSAKLVAVDIKGNMLNMTCGVICRNASLVMEECSVNNHISGGVLIYNDRETQCRISRCKFINNKPFNIEVLGSSYSFKYLTELKEWTQKSKGATQLGDKKVEVPPVSKSQLEEKTILIEENSIMGLVKSESEKEGIGIKIGVGARPKLFLNLIKDLDIGIMAISSDPFIYRNSITECREGIYTTTFNDSICEPRIKINEIRDHSENGIRVSGKNNCTVITNNTAIKKNKKAGIRVEKGAFARIVNNKISNNLNQGVLIVERANAYVENNMIFQNIKANVAFGGEQAENSVILRNKIFNSASEGIFVILAARCAILKNEIYGNYDGVICVESVPEFAYNNVFRNRNNGIICLRGSQPELRNNNIYENEGVGLVLREKSYGPSEGNTIIDNEMDLVVEYETLEIENGKFFEENKVGPDVKVPVQNKCTLI